MQCSGGGQSRPDKREITASLPDDLSEVDEPRRLGVSRVLVPHSRA